MTEKNEIRELQNDMLDDVNGGLGGNVVGTWEQAQDCLDVLLDKQPQLRSKYPYCVLQQHIQEKNDFAYRTDVIDMKRSDGNVPEVMAFPDRCM